jgi:predicted transglutaminase-like cysteine proteinase
MSRLLAPPPATRKISARLAAVLAAALLLSLTLLPVLQLQAAGATGAVFLQGEKSATDAFAFHAFIGPSWQRIVTTEKKSSSFSRNGAAMRLVDATSWRQLVEYLRSCPELEKLRMINAFFNQFPSRADKEIWGLREYWATPGEFYSARAGDCEDYAIAKYFALRFLGVEPDRMRIVVARLLKEHGEPHRDLHVILAVRTIGWLVLDSNRNDLYRLDPARGHLVPLYTMNEHGAWMANTNLFH